MAKIIAASNLKGGVGKTMTAVSLGFGLARRGKRVLVCDLDPQHSATASFGVAEPGKLAATTATALQNVIADTGCEPAIGIVHHAEGADLLPASSALAGMELALVQAIGRETVLRRHLDRLKPGYDFILLDCPPAMGLLTVNALAAANSVIIPVVPKFLDAKGLELLLGGVAQIRRQINPALAIEGILLTMVDRRARLTREIAGLIESAYGGKIRIFGERIPRSVRAAECSGQGASIFAHDPNGKAAAAYSRLSDEIIRGVAGDA
jgi:chromosome partitioning protein